MGTIDSMKSVLTQSALDALCERFHIPDVVHLELPGRNDRIRNSPADILAYFQINLSQLSVIAAAKVSHFEILCRVHGFVPTVGNFRRPLDSLKNWNDHFFWVDAFVFPLVVPWHNDKTLRNDPHPTPAEFNANVRYYDVDENCYPTFWANDDDEMDLFAFINHADPTKVQIGEREVAVGEIPLLQLTRGRVVPLAGVNDQGDVNAQGAGNDDVNEEGNDAAEADQTEQGDHIVHVGGIDIVSLLESSTLAVEVRVTAAATVPFVTSFVIPTPEREGPADSVSGTGLRTQHPAERFVISSDSSHDLNANDADDEVTSIVRSSVPPPHVLTAVVVTTIVADASSAPVHESGIRQA
ncbi:hypothetical protein Tco_0674137 [Tanacetum coccineum]